jgi:hypothetical protein
MPAQYINSVAGIYSRIVKTDTKYRALGIFKLHLKKTLCGHR